MRFIHTSDWHIGRLFQNISLLDDQLFALQQIKQYAIDYNVDALVIAGDIFDRSIPPADAVDALNDFFEQISELNIPIIMISGNHDSAKRLRFGAAQMQQSGLHILADIKYCHKPVLINSEIGQVAFYGIPYHDPVDVREAFAEQLDAESIDIKTYDQAHTFVANTIVEQHKNLNKHNSGIKSQCIENTVPSVLISHCFIDGASESDSERPLSIGGADRVSWQPLSDFDYVALGHLHAPQYKGERHIRYSGSLLKYSFSEHNQNKTINLVEMDAQGGVSQQQLPIKGKHDMRVITGTLDELILQGKSDSQANDYVLARVTDNQVILDPMGRLRQVYPNVLQMERTNFELSSNTALKRNVLSDNKRDETEIFSEFFKQVMDCDLSVEQQSILADIIVQARQQVEDKS